MTRGDLGSDAYDLGRRRRDQLATVSDAELRAEVRRQRSAQWRPRRLLQHKKHRPEFERRFGRPLSPSEVERLSHTILENHDHVFTSLEPDGPVTFAFIGSVISGLATIIVLTSGGVVRSLFLPRTLADWLDRHPEYVEVTNRVVGACG